MQEKQDYLIVYMASCFGSSEVSDRSFVDFDESTLCFSEIHAGNKTHYFGVKSQPLSTSYPLIMEFLSQEVAGFPTEFGILS